MFRSFTDSVAFYHHASVLLQLTSKPIPRMSHVVRLKCQIAPRDAVIAERIRCKQQQQQQPTRSNQSLDFIDHQTRPAAVSRDGLMGIADRQTTPVRRQTGGINIRPGATRTEDVMPRRSMRARTGISTNDDAPSPQQRYLRRPSTVTLATIRGHLL